VEAWNSREIHLGFRQSPLMDEFQRLERSGRSWRVSLAVASIVLISALPLWWRRPWERVALQSHACRAWKRQLNDVPASQWEFDPPSVATKIRLVQLGAVDGIELLAQELALALTLAGAAPSVEAAHEQLEWGTAPFQWPIDLSTIARSCSGEVVELGEDMVVEALGAVGLLPTADERLILVVPPQSMTETDTAPLMPVGGGCGQEAGALARVRGVGTMVFAGRLNESGVGEIAKLSLGMSTDADDWEQSASFWHLRAAEAALDALEKAANAPGAMVGAGVLDLVHQAEGVCASRGRAALARHLLESALDSRELSREADLSWENWFAVVLSGTAPILLIVASGVRELRK
jgi:hypothetical protein